jgi:5S rRNA maturation endonuclease (ribonuclease M5)
MGWKQLEGHDTLIITKSMKDILTFKSFMNVDVIAPQSESSHIGSSKLSYIKQNYKTVYVVFDYDDAGKIAAERLQEEGFIIRWVSQDVNPETGKPDDKDMSDFVTNHSLREALVKMKEMFHELDDKYFRDNRLKYFNDLCNKLRNEYL